MDETRRDEREEDRASPPARPSEHQLKHEFMQGSIQCVYAYTASIEKRGNSFRLYKEEEKKLG